MNVKKHQISVLMPVYNAADFLSAAITSILNQTFQDFEFLIFNDGSTDDSLKIIKSFKDSRIKVINSKINVGIAKNINHGLEIAKGKYLAKMDADDISLPRRFERQFQFMEANPEIGVCGTILKTFGQVEQFGGKAEFHKEIYTILNLWRNSIPHATTMIRNNMLKESGVHYSQEYIVCEDYALWVDLAKHTKFYNLQELHYLYRIHQTNISIRKYSEQRSLTKKILLRSIAELGELSAIDDKAKIELLYDFFQTSKQEYPTHESEIIKKYLAQILENPSICRETLIKNIGKERFALFQPSCEC